MTAPVRAVLLDVNGTLFPPSAAAPVFEKLGLQESTIEVAGFIAWVLDRANYAPWFAAVLRDGFAAQLAGRFVPFRDIAGYHLEALLRAAGNSRASKEEAVEELVAAWQGAEPFQDVGPGIRALHAAGIQVAALTNGSVGIAHGVLGRAGVGDLVGPVLDISMAQAWKPARESYAFALGRLRLASGEVMMVASHPWDIHGAMQAGLQGAYVQRKPHEPYPPFPMPQPHLVVASFEELAARLVENAAGKG